MSKEADKAAEAFGKFITVTGITFISMTLRGWAITIVWRWFIASRFELPQLRIPEALGLGLVISLLAPSPDRDPKVTYSERLASALTLPLVCLGIGWIIHFFM